MSDTTNTTLYTPVLDWISYSSGILSASWTSAADESEYYFEVKLSNKSDDRDSRVCKVKGCTNCNWSLAEEKDFNINIDTTYTVKVIQTDQSYSQFGDWSNEITLINAGPGNVSVEYNGTELKVSWDAKVGTLPLHGGSVSIYDITKTDPLKTYPFDGSSGIIKPFPPLDSNLSYVITVAGMNPGSTGPASDPVDILQQPVQISKLQYTNNTLIATTNQVAVNPTTLTLFLYVDGQLTEQSPPQSGGSVFYTVENSLELCQYNEVRLAFTKGGSRGPLSKPVAAIPGVPVLHSVYYDGAKIKAIWSNPPGEPVPTEGSIELFDDTQNNGQIDNAPAIGNSGTLVPKVVIDPSKSYDLRVASVYGISIGTNSASLAVISSVKQISSVDYDNGKITVSWPQGQLYGATGYLLSLESNGSTIATQNAGDTKGCINYRLDPESEYNVLLQAIGNNTVGPSSNPAAVISAQVRVKQVTTQDNGAVYAELDNTVAPVGGSISGYMAILYKDEVPVEKPVAASGTPLSVEFSYTPQILDNCYVRAQAIGSNSTGPLSSPVDVILGVPVIESIKCSDATHAYIQWSAVQEKCVTGYMLTVENSTDPQTHFCSSPCYTIPVASWQNYSITVQAVGNKTKGKCSQTINFSTDVLDVTSIHYDGSSITAAWPDASISGSNYELLLSSNYSVFMTFPTITNHVVIPTLLSQGVPYSLQVRVVNGLFTGSPGSLVAVISDVPGIISITYDSFQVKVVIDDTNTKGKSGISLYKAFLYENGDLFEEFVTTPESPLSAVFNKPLKKNCSYSVTVQAIDTNCCFTGPECEAEPVISGVPVIDSIDNDGNNALISWSTVSGNAVTGYNVVLTDAEGNSYPTDTAESSITLTLDSSKSYSVTVQAIGKKASGVISQSVYILNEVISINTASYDGKFINASLTTSSTTGASYELYLFNGNDLEECYNTVINSAVVPVVLDTDSSYSLKVRTVNGVVRGPLGPAFTVISAVPGINSITNDSGQVTFVVNDANTTGKPGISLYQAFLYKGADLFDDIVTTPESPLSAAFKKTLEKTCSYSVTVKAIGTNCEGPECEAEPVISGVPVIDFIDNDGNNALISWSTVSGNAVTGYKVVLTDTDPIDTADSSITFTLDSSKSYSVKVRAIGNKVIGAFSNSVDISNEKLNINNVSYDGEFVHATWAASAVTGASYELCLFNGNDLEECYNTVINSAVVPAILDAESSYSLKVRTVNGVVRGPLGPAFTVISAVPGINSITDDSGQVTVVVNDANTTGKPGISLYQAFLYKGDALFDGPVTASRSSGSSESSLSAVFNKALEEHYSYSVKVQAIGTNCEGPKCDAIPVVSDAPVITYAYYDGAQVTASWSPVLSAGLTGYLAILTSSTTQEIPAKVNASNTSVCIPLDYSNASGTYSLCVRAFNDISTGPCSDPADPIGAGFCLSANKDKAAAVLPMSGSLPQAPFEMVCYLPELYKTAPQTLPSSDPFILSALTGTGSFKYKITFAPDSMVWNFDSSPVRTSLLDSYQKFLLSLEGKAPNQDPTTIGILLPGAIQDVVDTIAGMMPQTFAETLYYHYGLLTQNNYTDLRPGMRLRLEYQQWQSVSSQPPQYINGYVGNNIAEYDIGSYLNGSGNTSVGFNNFLSSLSNLAVPTPAASGSGPVDGGGGVIDLFFREFQRPFYRIIYPSTFKSSSNQGSSNPKDNALILAAADWFTLSDITQKITNGASIPAIGTNYAILYMRGRAAMTPLICISVNGTSIWVPVGTTLSQVLEQYGIKPFSLPASVGGLRYIRKSGNMYANISEQAPKFITGLSLPVHFEWGNSVIYSNSSGWFNLPVLQGDQITFTGE